MLFFPEGKESLCGMALGGFTHFKMKKLLLLLFLLPNLVMAGPDCNWKSINSETIKLKKFFVEITTYDCNHEHYKDENITKKTASILDTKKNILFKDISKAREADLFKIINIPEGFPYHQPEDRGPGVLPNQRCDEQPSDERCLYQRSSDGVSPPACEFVPST